jgi:hypothetical protein
LVHSTPAPIVSWPIPMAELTLLLLLTFQ